MARKIGVVVITLNRRIARGEIIPDAVDSRGFALFNVNRVSKLREVEDMLKFSRGMKRKLLENKIKKLNPVQNSGQTYDVEPEPELVNEIPQSVYDANPDEFVGNE